MNNNFLKNWKKFQRIPVFALEMFQNLVLRSIDSATAPLNCCVFYVTTTPWLEVGDQQLFLAIGRRPRWEPDEFFLPRRNIFVRCSACRRILRVRLRPIKPVHPPGYVHQLAIRSRSSLLNPKMLVSFNLVLHFKRRRDQSPDFNKIVSTPWN